MPGEIVTTNRKMMIKQWSVWFNEDYGSGSMLILHNQIDVLHNNLQLEEIY